jgi:hypothetical protein
MELDMNTLKNFSAIFDKFSNVEFRNLNKQFSSDKTKVDKNRLDLDLAFLKALNPSINNDLARESLLKVYGKLKKSLDAWINST